MNKINIKAWAVIPRDENSDFAWGNGKEFQYAIFPSRKEARSFFESHYESKKIIRVSVKSI